MLINIVKLTALMLAAAFAVQIAVPAQAQSVPDIVGTWHGAAKTPAGEITLVLHVERGADATLSAQIENVTQSPGNLAPVSDIKVTSGHLAFRIARGNTSYEGDWDSAAQQWKGTLTTGTAGGDFNFAKGAPPPWQLPSDAEIARLIAARNAPRPGQGIVVGVLGPDGQRIVAGGTGAGARFDRSTLFEIGSITKVFTALVLADMVNKGEVSLDDPAAKYLPAGHRMPERGGRQITLRDLSTHREYSNLGVGANLRLAERRIEGESNGTGTGIYERLVCRISREAA